ncbi:SMI1/KNR4 family protein [Nonomuraea sp. ZG12]|uniref:SMI1/KNR4 family protein n=1 Tax=Nonomuraea sp. ZG12 TaxID=3452207 RepID=UPI003F8BC3DE
MNTSDTPLYPWLEVLRADMPGASEAEILVHEERLGTRLPPSYRQFLQTSNGWLLAEEENEESQDFLSPLVRIGWFRDIEPTYATGWFDNDPRRPLPTVPDEEYFIYGEGQDCSLHFRTEYVADTLLIGAEDEGQFLLNPHIKTPDGEWEAWYLAHWLPGAQRYRSFWDLINDRFHGTGI